MPMLLHNLKKNWYFLLFVHRAMFLAVLIFIIRYVYLLTLQVMKVACLLLVFQ